MKLTIWQQFSSNHSGSFHVVGVFTRPDEAQKAADELRSILQTIQDWHRTNPEKAKALYQRRASGDEYPPPLSEIEETLASKYHVRWPYGIDWFDWAKVEVLQGHLVHLYPKHQVDWGALPFVQIIERLGGIGFMAGEDVGQVPFGEIWVTLSCDAPDVETASELEQTKTMNHHDNEKIESVQRYNDHLVFRWEWYRSIWKLEKLITELEEKGCTELRYYFSGNIHVVTGYYPVPKALDEESSCE